MAGQTKVEGNRVTLEDAVYELKPAGADQFSVSDEFGRHLGYIRLQGRRVIPEDYGLDGVHSLAAIGRLWAPVHLAAGLPAPPLATKGICRIATHAGADDAALEKARAHRAWQRKQPGVTASYLVRDPATGNARTITICRTRAAMDALDAATGAEGAPLESTSVDVFPFVEDP